MLKWNSMRLKYNEIVNILRWGGREKYFCFGYRRNIKYQLSDLSNMSDSYLVRLDVNSYISYIKY